MECRELFSFSHVEIVINFVFLADIPTHTGEKPYKVFKATAVTTEIVSFLPKFQCNICFKDFRQPCPYRKHMQTHTGDKEDLLNAPN